MKKAVSIGFSALLLCHTLAYVLVCVGSWWKAEHDLSKQLLIYRTVDSIVEFHIPLNGRTDVRTLTDSDGFGYRGHYYDVVSLEVRNDTLHLAGLESKNRPFWQSDLLSFLNNHFSNPSDSEQKTHQFLKFLLKEYSPNPRVEFRFRMDYWREAVRIPAAFVLAVTRALPVHSPPPER